MSRRRLIVAAVSAGALLAGALVAALVLTTGASTPRPPGAGRVNALLQGVPQTGTALGSPSAPVTLVEFADLQCPFCADWARGALPALVERYVRPGKVRIVFSGMAFVGPDSETALRTALAAAQQQRFWNVLELLYESQGAENAGWVTESLLGSIGRAVPGLDWRRMLDARHSAAVDRALVDAGALAQRAGVRSTPTFAVGRTGQSLSIVRVQSLDAAGIEPALEAALRQ